jgi:hypothetical protein
MAEQVSGSESSAAHLPKAWEHVKAAGEEIRKGLGAVVPPEVHEHGRAARREALLAARSVIDAALARLDKRPSA